MLVREGIVTCGNSILVAKSCNKCMVLKDASEFDTRVDGYYQSTCKSCLYPMSHASRIKYNAESRLVADRHGTVWTLTEIERVEKLVVEGKQSREIAAALGRSLTSIYNIRQKYRIYSPQHYTATPGTPINPDHLKEAFSDHLAQEALPEE